MRKIWKHQRLITNIQEHERLYPAQSLSTDYEIILQTLHQLPILEDGWQQQQLHL